MAMADIHGLVGPKLRLKSVSDGQQVNIPVLPIYRDGARELRRQAPYWFGGTSNKLVEPGKSGSMFSIYRMKTSCDVKVNFGDPTCRINFPGKTSSCSTTSVAGRIFR